MTSVFDRLAAAFVAPRSADSGSARDAASVVDRPGPRAVRARRPDVPATVAVLCRPADALVVGGAVALLLASRPGAGHAVVAVWGGDPPAVRSPATGPARRLAATLAGRGHDAVATGRLAVVRLAGDLRLAAAEAVRVLAASPGAPGVVVVAGAREHSADELLRAQDRVLVAAPPADAHVATLALAGLEALGVAARLVELPAVAAPARALAASGMAVMPPLRTAVKAGLGEMALDPPQAQAAPDPRFDGAAAVASRTERRG